MKFWLRRNLLNRRSRSRLRPSRFLLTFIFQLLAFQFGYSRYLGVLLFQEVLRTTLLLLLFVLRLVLVLLRFTTTTITTTYILQQLLHLLGSCQLSTCLCTYVYLCTYLYLYAIHFSFFLPTLKQLMNQLDQTVVIQIQEETTDLNRVHQRAM